MKEPRMSESEWIGLIGLAKHLSSGQCGYSKALVRRISKCESFEAAVNKLSALELWRMLRWLYHGFYDNDYSDHCTYITISMMLKRKDQPLSETALEFLKRNDWEFSYNKQHRAVSWWYKGNYAS